MRKVEPGDVDRIYGWVKNPWYVNEFAGRGVPTPESHRAYFERVFASEEVFLAVERDGEHVGCCGIRYIEGGSAEGWWYIGDESMRGKGVGTALISALVEYAKTELGLTSMYAHVLETNVSCRKALEKNGFMLMPGSYGEHGGVLRVRYNLSFFEPGSRHGK